MVRAEAERVLGRSRSVLGDVEDKSAENLAAVQAEVRRRSVELDCTLNGERPCASSTPCQQPRTSVHVIR